MKDYLLNRLLFLLDFYSKGNKDLYLYEIEVKKLNDYINTLIEKNRQLTDLCNMLSKKKDIVNMTKEIEEIEL